MEKYRIYQVEVFDAFERFQCTKYVVKNKHWLFGWCCKYATDDIEKLDKVVGNIKSQGGEISLDVSVTGFCINENE